MSIQHLQGFKFATYSLDKRRNKNEKGNTDTRKKGQRITEGKENKYSVDPVLVAAPALFSLRPASIFLQLRHCTVSGGSLLIPALDTFFVDFWPRHVHFDWHEKKNTCVLASELGHFRLFILQSAKQSCPLIKI
jgi:hypothetical protein